jgi:hypothetical protein
MKFRKTRKQNKPNVAMLWRNKAEAESDWVWHFKVYADHAGVCNTKLANVKRGLHRLEVIERH